MPWEMHWENSIGIINWPAETVSQTCTYRKQKSKKKNWWRYNKMFTLTFTLSPKHNKHLLSWATQVSRKCISRNPIIFNYCVSQSAFTPIQNTIQTGNYTFSSNLCFPRKQLASQFNTHKKNYLSFLLSGLNRRHILATDNVYPEV